MLNQITVQKPKEILFILSKTMKASPRHIQIQQRLAPLWKKGTKGAHCVCIYAATRQP